MTSIPLELNIMSWMIKSFVGNKREEVTSNDVIDVSVDVNLNINEEILSFEIFECNDDLHSRFVCITSHITFVDVDQLFSEQVHRLCTCPLQEFD